MKSPSDVSHALLNAARNAVGNAVRWGTSPLRRRQALQRVLMQARHPLEPENDDRLMAFWAVLSRTGLRDRQGELLDAGRRYARRVERHPERRTAWTHMRFRLDELEGSLDAYVHFERISGHRVEPVRTIPKRPERKRMARPARTQRPSRSPIPGRASVAILAVWLLLIMVTHSTVPDPFAFTAVGQSGYAWEEVGERTRGATVQPSSGQAITYAAALAHARSARYTWLGLFPGYDTETLMEARAMMAAAIEQAKGGYSVPEQAYRTLDIIDGLVAERTP